MYNRHGATLVREQVELIGSFIPDGTDPPTGVRDGNTNAISVAYTSTGLYTVTIADWVPGDFVPSEWITEQAWVNPVDATPVLVVTAGIVEGSWDQGDRTFQILCTLVGDTGASAYFDPAPSPPDAGSRVCFKLVGTANYNDQES